MSSKGRVSGIVYLFTCFNEENTNGAQNLYCYTNWIECIMALTILVLGVYCIYQRYLKHNELTRHNRKSVILMIMVVNVSAYLIYQWSLGSPLLYFPEYYFQYVFFCYTIYYFARKSILLGMLNLRMDIVQQDLDPIVQLKLSKIFCIGLVSFFTIIFILNYVQYFMQVSQDKTYDLCQAKFFNVVTTVGFLMQGFFILQVKQLSRQVEKNMDVQQLEQAMQNLQEAIQVRKQSLWMLVVVCFIGSFATFVQNIYFVTMNAQFNADNPSVMNQYTCWYVNMPNIDERNAINAFIGTSIKIVAFFLPYFITLKVFWLKPEIDIPIPNDENEFDSYKISFKFNNGQHQEQNSTELI